ncbi:MAG: hypothetical protein NTV46_19220 [Verrucomicrobia bacterium]|nr:hypothetical protein [Verrucomicrobiota bacterium]
MKPQDPQAERIMFGVELETTIPATAGLVVGGYPEPAASDPTNETMKQQTGTMICHEPKARAKREGWAS